MEGYLIAGGVLAVVLIIVGCGTLLLASELTRIGDTLRALASHLDQTEATVAELVVLWRAQVEDEPVAPLEAAERLHSLADAKDARLRLRQRLNASGWTHKAPKAIKGQVK